MPYTGLYTIEAIGARGGGSYPGKGARMSGGIYLYNGDILKVLGGQTGVSHADGKGGGGGTFITIDDGYVRSSFIWGFYGLYV